MLMVQKRTESSKPSSPMPVKALASSMRPFRSFGLNEVGSGGVASRNWRIRRVCLVTSASKRS